MNRVEQWLDAITWVVNPIVFIMLIIVVLGIGASRRGWGWLPLWLVLGLVVIVLIVGILTGLAIIPDGVDIFTVLIGSLGLIAAMVYMIFRPQKR
ncbi:MAG: hypothetical protein ACO3F2_06555 [Roseiflexaceae bacterium]